MPDEDEFEVVALAPVDLDYRGGEAKKAKQYVTFYVTA